MSALLVSEDMNFIKILTKYDRVICEVISNITRLGGQRSDRFAPIGWIWVSLCDVQRYSCAVK